MHCVVYHVRCLPTFAFIFLACVCSHFFIYTYNHTYWYLIINRRHTRCKRWYLWCFSDLCQGVECQWGARCEAGECVCPTNCGGSAGIHMSEPVCASNMVTYPNECELQRASCNQPPDLPPLTVIFYGDCREKNVVPASMLHAFCWVGAVLQKSIAFCWHFFMKDPYWKK